MKLQTFVLNPKIRAINLVLIDQLSFIQSKYMSIMVQQVHVCGSKGVFLSGSRFK